MSERPQPYVVGPPPLPLMQCPIAGFQFHGGEGCWTRLRIDDLLVLQREPGNRHDPRAITVQWRGVMLGYVPREANYALSQMMDGGVRVEGRVKALRAGADPWHRVMMEVTVQPAAAALPPPREPERIRLWSPPSLAPPRLQLARPPNGLTAAQREMGLPVLHDCLPEILARLARPAIGVTHEHQREVRLWDSVAIVMGADGRGLVAHYLEGTSGPSLTLDLKRPLSAGGWINCFVPTIAKVCGRHGLSKANASEELQRWIGDSLTLTFDGILDFEALRKVALDFLAVDPLARSLANRIFDGSLAAPAFNWVCDHAAALALTAVEQPAMLPFLRIVQDEKAMRVAADPLAALRERLQQEGLAPGAWKKIPQWSFGAFARMGEPWWKPAPIARFANLLHRLQAQAPRAEFAEWALDAALYRAQPRGTLDFERHPLWFMRALMREVESVDDDVGAVALGCEVEICLDWLIDTRPEPDANQQRAGWPWMLEQAFSHRKARELALAAPWAVPVRGMVWGTYQVVAILSAAELVAEAQAMKNCLATYEDACRSGEFVVYSIRQRATGTRVACFAAQRLRDGSWELVEVAGKMNTAVGEEIERIGHAMVVKLNGGRGGAVAPF